MHKTAVGYAEAASTGLANFDGTATDNDMILLRYTYAGDANLDGAVTPTDFNFLAINFNSVGKSWVNGDFNFDGLVNAMDFNLLASNFGATPIPGASLGTLVPEPVAPTVALCAGLLAGRRRRRH
jgi:hypothetical protein